MINDKSPSFYESMKINGVNQGDTKPANDPLIIKENEKPGIFIKNVSAKWSEDAQENTLTNVNLEVTPGHLTAVIGPVGAGKVFIHSTSLGCTCR